MPYLKESPIESLTIGFFNERAHPEIRVAYQICKKQIRHAYV